MKAALIKSRISFLVCLSAREILRTKAMSLRPAAPPFPGLVALARPACCAPSSAICRLRAESHFVTPRQPSSRPFFHILGFGTS